MEKGGRRCESIDFNGCSASLNGIVCYGTSVVGLVLDSHGISGVYVFANLTMLLHRGPREHGVALGAGA
jgi:hypothetical protein